MPPLRLAALALIAVAALGGCGGGGNPLQRVIEAADGTRALPATSYVLTLAGQRFTPHAVKMLGGRAAYDLGAGVGYEALTVQRTAHAKQTVYLDFLRDSVLVAPWPTPAGLVPPGKVW